VEKTYIVEDQEAGVVRGNRRAFTDPESLEQERARLFSKCWIYVGHESEIPYAGDHRARTVAGRPVVLVRGDDVVLRQFIDATDREDEKRNL
jgi:p-cumate 2,3-dioxygenase alpha subunit